MIMARADEASVEKLMDDLRRVAVEIATTALRGGLTHCVERAVGMILEGRSGRVLQHGHT